MDQNQPNTTTQSGEVVLTKYNNASGQENMEVEGGQQMEEQVLGYLEVQPSQLQAVQEGGTIYFQSDGLELDEQLILAQGGEGGEMIIVVRTDQDGMNFTSEGGESGLRAVKFGDLAGLAEQMGLAPGTKISLQSEDDKEDGSGITYLTYEAPGEEYEQQVQDGLQTNENISDNTYMQEHGEMTEIPVSVSEDGTLTPLRIIEKSSEETNSERNETIAVISMDDKNMSSNAYLQEQGEITEIPVSVSEDGTITPYRIVEKPCHGENTNNAMRDDDENQCYIAVGVNGEELNNVEEFNNAVESGRRSDIPNKHPMVVHLSTSDESRNAAESDSKMTTVEVLREPDSNQIQYETANGENSFQTTIVTSDGEHQQVEYRIVQASDIEGERLQSGMTDAECYGQWSAMDTSGQELSNDMVVSVNQNEENIEQEERVSHDIQPDQEISGAKLISKSANHSEAAPINETLRSIEEFLREASDTEAEATEKEQLNSASEKTITIEEPLSKEEVAVDERQNSSMPIEITLENDTQEVHEMEVMGELPQNTTSYVVIDLDNAQQFTNAMGNSIQMESVNFKSVINEHGQSVGILETANGDLEVILDSDSLVPSANSSFTKSNHDDEISIISNHSSFQEVLAPQFQKAFHKLMNTPDKRGSSEHSSYQVNLSSGKSKSNSKHQSESDASKRGENATKKPRERKQTVFDVTSPPEDLTVKIPTRQYSRTSRKKTAPSSVASTSKDTLSVEPQGNEFGRNEIILVIEPNEGESLKYDKNEQRNRDLELSPNKLEIVCEEQESKIIHLDDSSEENKSNLDAPKILSTYTKEITTRTKEIEETISKETGMTKDYSKSSPTISQTSVEHFESNTELGSEIFDESKSENILSETREILTKVTEEPLKSCKNFEKLPELLAEDPEPESLAEDPEPESLAEGPEPESLAEDPEPESLAEDPEPESLAEDPEPESLAEDPEPESLADEPEPESLVDEPEPESLAEDPEPESLAENPEPESLTGDLEPESLAEDIEPESLAEDNAPESLADEPELESGTEEPELELVSQEPESVTENPELESVTGDAEQESVTENAEPKSITEDAELESITGDPEQEFATLDLEPESITEEPELESTANDLEPGFVTENPEPKSVTEELKPDSVTEYHEPEECEESITEDCEQDSDSLSLEICGIPQENATKPEEWASIPEKHIAISREAVELPQEAVAVPSESVATPIEMVSVSQDTIDSQEDSLDARREVSEPLEDVSVPLEDASIPDDALLVSRDSIPSREKEVDAFKIGSDDVETASNDVQEFEGVPETTLALAIGQDSSENKLRLSEENSNAVAKKSLPETTEEIAKLTGAELIAKKDILDEPESENEKGDSENERVESEIERMDSEIDNDIRDSVLSGGKSLSADEENSQFDFEREGSIPDKDNEDVMKETIILDDSNLDSIKINTGEVVKERRGRKRQSDTELGKEAKRTRPGETRQKVSTSSSVSVIKEKNVKRKLFNENSGKKIGRPKKNLSGGKAYQSQDELFDELLKESVPNIAKKRKESKDYSRKSKNFNSDSKRRRTMPPRLPNDYPSSDEEDVVLSNLFPYPDKKFKSDGKGKRGRGGKLGRPRLNKNRGSSDEEEVMMSNLRIYPEVQGHKRSYSESSKRGRGRPRIGKNVNASSYSRFEISSRQSKSEPTKRGRGKQKSGARSKKTKKECEIHFCYQQSNPEKIHQTYTCKECHFRTSRMANIIRHYKDCSLDLFPFKSSSLTERTPNRFKLDGATSSKSLPESRLLNKKFENPKKLSPSKSERNVKSNKSRRNDDPNASKDENSMGTDDPENSEVTCDSEEDDSYDIEMKNTFGFAENDVVWAEWRNQHWPALVRKIYPRQKKVSVFFISSPMPDKGFTMNVKKITNFDDAAKNKDFLEKGYSLQKNDQLVKSAQLAEDYLRKKCLGLKMSATQFFNDPDAAKQLLSELEESAENLASDQSDSNANDPMTPIAIIDLDRLAHPAQDESENPCESEDGGNEGENLVKFVLEGNSDEHLIQVHAGILNSERHRLFVSDLESDRASVKRASNYKGVVQDEGKKVELTQYCMDLFKNKITSSVGFNVVGYAYEVMVPEAILKAISTLHNIPLEEAEQIFAKNDVDKTQSIFSTSISENDLGQVIVSGAADQEDVETLVLAPDSVHQATETLVLTPDSVDQAKETLDIIAPDSVVEENPLTIDSAVPPRETCPGSLTELPT